MTHPQHICSGSLSAPVGLLALGIAAGAAQAQTVDYSRAERFLNWNASDLIAGDQVNPTWLHDGNRFWYRNKTGGGAEFIIVDPVRNTKGPVFDHARLAAAMSLAADTAFEPHELPFDSFAFVDNERAIEFNAARKRFKCVLVNYSCTLGDTLANRNAYVASPDSSLEVFYRDYNLWIRPYGGGDSTQLTTDGEKYWSYGAGERRPTELLRERQQPPRPNVRWSPDARKIAVYRQDARNVEHMHYISYTSQRPRHFSQPYALPGDTIVPIPNVHIIDVQTRQNLALRLFPVPNQLWLGHSPVDSAWSKDASRFRFFYLTRASKSMYFVEADASTGAIRVLAKDTSKTWVETNPQGRPSYTITDDGEDIIWWSERDGWPHLWRLDGKAGIQTVVTTEDGEDGDGQPKLTGRTTGDVRIKNQITSGAWAVGEVVHLDHAKKQIYSQAEAASRMSCCTTRNFTE